MPEKTRQAVTARTEITAGVAGIVNEFDRGDDLPSEAAEKIVTYVLTHKRVHELFGKPVDVTR